MWILKKIRNNFLSWWGLDFRLGAIEEKMISLQNEMWFMENQIFFLYKSNCLLSQELLNKISYDEFEKFEKHISRLEQIFA